MSDIMDEYYRMLPDYKSLCVEIELQEDDSDEINDDLDMEQGKPLEIKPNEPLRFEFSVDEDDVLPGEEWFIPAYNSEGPTFDVSLIKILQDLGVDNMEVFPAILINNETGVEFTELHAAVNIIGLVSCANDEMSNSRPLADTKYYLNLKIDPEKARGLLMFRLAEQPVDIIVHEKIAQAVQENGYKGIIFEKVS